MSSSSTITRTPATGHDYASMKAPLPHPGELLREAYLPDYDITPEALASGMERPLNQVRAVLSGAEPISPDFALRLGKVFRQDPSLWMRMQGSHDLSKAAIAAREELKRIEPLVSSRPPLAAE